MASNLFFNLTLIADILGGGYFDFEGFNLDVSWILLQICSFVKQLTFKCQLRNTSILVLLNIPLIARTQLSSTIVFLTSESFSRQRNGSITKQNATTVVEPAAVPTWAWPDTVGTKIIKSEPTNSVSHTMKVTPMLTSVSLRRLIFVLSDSNFSKF